MAAGQRGPDQQTRYDHTDPEHVVHNDPVDEFDQLDVAVSRGTPLLERVKKRLV